MRYSFQFQLNVKLNSPNVCPGLNANKPGHSLWEKIKLNINENGGKSFLTITI